MSSWDENNARAVAQNRRNAGLPPQRSCGCGADHEVCTAQEDCDIDGALIDRLAEVQESRFSAETRTLVMRRLTRLVEDITALHRTDLLGPTADTLAYNAALDDVMKLVGAAAAQEKAP